MSDHQIVHEHDHEHAHDRGEHKPVEQLYALIKYMAGHNADYTRELEELARDVSAAGNLAVYDKIMEAVVLFDKGNEALKTVLDEFGKE